MFFAGALVEGYGWPPWQNIGWMILAGVGARTVAMALNRLIDRAIDARNPRTAQRELPANLISMSMAYGVTLAGFLAYIIGAYALGGWCLKLMWVPLLFFIAYPYMKRWTAWCHFGVGITLGLAPLGGALAAHPALLPGPEPYLLVIFTTLWVTGFDIIYATLDEEFDRNAGIHSAIVYLGKSTALRLAMILHSLAILTLFVLLFVRVVEYWQWLALLFIVILFVIEHLKRENVDFAFFQVNSVIGFFVLIASF
jgi:4-hydroxybenzoate polyprenyltransferase